jgi:hypothetical protein
MIMVFAALLMMMMMMMRDEGAVAVNATMM